MIKTMKKQARQTKTHSNPDQSQAFVDTARKLGVDEDEAAFDDTLRRLTQPKPEKDKAPDK